MENGTTAVRVTQLYWLTPVGAYLLENLMFVGPCIIVITEE